MNWSDFQLKSPSEHLKDAFLIAYDGISEKSEKLAWLYIGDNADLNTPAQNFSKYVETMIRRETRAQEGFVCDTTFWTVHRGQMIGRISIRHELNDFLKKIGGHIGYIVHPSWRNKGIATWMLSELLKTQRARAIGELLLTCDEDNIGSQRTIIKNGGVFQKAIDMGVGRPKKMHFWIKLR